MRKMKDSGIQWIGQIPENWRVNRAAPYALEVDCPNVGNTETNALQFKMGKIISKSVGDSKYHPETLEAYNKVKNGDVIINGLNLVFDFISQRVGLVKEDGVITSAYIALRPTNISSEYITYLYKAYDICKVFHGMGKGLRATLTYDEIKRCLIIIPPLDEQTRIANFLDQKCSAIDSVLEKTKASIEEYKKLKQSVITQAVTKGIRPNRPMKDSGIEWIGQIPEKERLEMRDKRKEDCFSKTSSCQNRHCEQKRSNPEIPDEKDGNNRPMKDSGIKWIGQIPEDWEVKKIKYSCKTRNEKYIPTKGILNYFALENIVSWNSKYVETENKYELEGSILCYKDDVVFGKLRPYLAKTYLIEYDRCCSPEFAVFYNFQGISKFYLYLFTSYGFVTSVDVSTLGVKMPRANIEYIRNMFIPLPPLPEQQAIADYLDAKCSEIDNLIAKKEQFLKEIETYKKSLIYEYVTGKKEV